MAKPGPKPKVSDDRLLLELLVSENRAVFAGQVQENVNLDTIQGVRDRLNDLCNDTPYVVKKEVSGRNLYSLTDEGRDHIVKQLRSLVD
jgi:predicted transcriptional regulator